MEEKSTPEQVKVAREAADWLLDGIATATQDRRFLRGDPEYDEVVGEAILANGKIACLRALHNLTPDIATSETDALRAENERLREALEAFANYMHTDEGRIDLDNNGDEVPGDQCVGWIYLTHGDFRKARAALKGGDA